MKSNKVASTCDYAINVHKCVGCMFSIMCIITDKYGIRNFDYHPCLNHMTCITTCVTGIKYCTMSLKEATIPLFVYVPSEQLKVQ